jgi:hypothetical protein
MCAIYHSPTTSKAEVAVVIVTPDVQQTCRTIFAIYCNREESRSILVWVKQSGHMFQNLTAVTA